VLVRGRRQPAKAQREQPVWFGAWLLLFWRAVYLRKALHLSSEHLQQHDLSHLLEQRLLGVHVWKGFLMLGWNMDARHRLCRWTEEPQVHQHCCKADDGCEHHSEEYGLECTDRGLSGGSNLGSLGCFLGGDGGFLCSTGLFNRSLCLGNCYPVAVK